ncbi:NADH-quinone oxidoreductase subunit NuoE [Pseudahrensia aquimaris]|uniref:NADH-quinone oxidoreductase subunit NuoE n=1 Tax=Pseudahrensia aquimaris TaxID=744461 RepID=A0ABW3FI62_9HYPH
MSVRRLAEAEVQPQAFSFNRDNAAWAKKKLKDYPKERKASGVIPLLMRAQEQDGWVTKAAIEHIAEMLEMPMIRVLEVATFYTQFQLAPVGTKAHIQVCGTTPCMLRGSEDLMKVCKKKIAPNPFELNAEGTLSWEEVECQGACVNAPMVMIFKDTYEDLTPERLEEIIDDFEAGKGDSVKPGPQIDRIYSAPIGGLTSLTEADAKPTKRKATNAKAEKPAATKAARPASHVATTSPAVETPVGKAASKKAVAKKSTARAKAATPSPKKAAAKAADAGKPPAMKKPKQPDDLKLIAGVGPKIEGILNELGVYKFEQIVKWKKAEREWVDGYLRFSGRIERDEWTKQAKALAKGGRDEYVRVFGKEPR